MKRRFVIKLKDAHVNAGLTPYAIAKELKLNQNTVRKYLTDIVETDELLSHVILLCDFLGLDWRDPAVVEVVEEGDTRPMTAIREDTEPEFVPPLTERVAL